MLLLLSKYKMKSIPVVDLGVAKIENIITQSGVIHMLAECAGLHWFEDWGIKTLSEVGLPIMSKDHIIKASLESYSKSSMEFPFFLTDYHFYFRSMRTNQFFRPSS